MPEAKWAYVRHALYSLVGGFGGAALLHRCVASVSIWAGACLRSVYVSFESAAVRRSTVGSSACTSREQGVFGSSSYQARCSRLGPQQEEVLMSEACRRWLLPRWNRTGSWARGRREVALIVFSHRLPSILNLRLIILILDGVLCKRFRHLRLNPNEMGKEQQQIGQEDKYESHRSRANEHEGIHLTSRCLLALHQLLWDHCCNMCICTVWYQRSNLPQHCLVDTSWSMRMKESIKIDMSLKKVKNLVAFVLQLRYQFRKLLWVIPTWFRKADRQRKLQWHIGERDNYLCIWAINLIIAFIRKAYVVKEIQTVKRFEVILRLLYLHDHVLNVIHAVGTWVIPQLWIPGE